MITRRRKKTTITTTIIRIRHRRMVKVSAANTWLLFTNLEILINPSELWCMIFIHFLVAYFSTKYCNVFFRQQEQEVFTFVPLRALQLQAQEPSTGYHQYQINTQYQVPDMRQLPLSDPQGLNNIVQDILSAEFNHLPQLNMELRPPRIRPQTPSMTAQV